MPFRLHMSYIPQLISLRRWKFGVLFVLIGLLATWVFYYNSCNFYRLPTISEASVDQKKLSKLLSGIAKCGSSSVIPILREAVDLGLIHPGAKEYGSLAAIDDALRVRWQNESLLGSDLACCIALYRESPSEKKIYYKSVILLIVTSQVP